MYEYETIIVNADEVTDGVAHNSQEVDFGRRGYSKGVVSIENSHDQIVGCQVQGKAGKGTVWQNVGAAVNAAAIAAGIPGIATVSVTVPWNRLRVQYTAVGAPASGSVTIWLNVAIY